MTSLLGVGTTTIIDRVNTLDVSLSDPQALLYHADADALAMGGNAALVGSEVIQFGRALALGSGGFRLSDLVRGRRGTEHAVAGHASGERIVLLDPARLTRVTMDLAMIGAEIVVRAYGVADDAANPPQFIGRANGESLRPMSPCHLDARLDAAGWTVRWVARRAASTGWSSDDGGAASFGVTIRRGSGVLTRTTGVSMLVIAAAEIAALGTGPIEFEVIEQSDLPSRGAVRVVNA